MNILDAITNIIKHSSFKIKSSFTGRNRANNVGEALETFIKDAFAGTLNEEEEINKIERFADVFSWQGNQNHPPDVVLRGGDAIEVKKIQGVNNDLALNSSFPKAKLTSDNPMISSGCKTCEDWTEKDIIYCVGNTTDTSIKSIWMVYGSIYAAESEIYKKIKQKISDGINEIPNVELAPTNELGRVNRVDPLGITNLRIRGMWSIQNPKRVFSYIHTNTPQKFELVVIIPLEKYKSFDSKKREKLEILSSEGLTIKDVKVKSPNNPSQLIPCKLLTYQLEEDILVNNEEKQVK